MDLNFQVTIQILLFTASEFTSTTSHIHNWVLFLLWLHLFILCGVISPLIPSSILDTYQPAEALQIAVKRREVKSKGEKERYKHLNAEFQRIARRDKKAFCSDQCKEIEANNRMGKTRDLFKKIRDTKGTFHAKIGSIKDRNGMDLTEAEDIKKRWQEYTEELYKK